MTSTKQFVVSADFKREERDAGSSVTRRFFERGQTIGATSDFFTRCRPDSVTEMTDGSGVVQAQYAFDPFGRSTKLQGSLEADFQYAGYYMHQRSRLNLAVFRAYSAQLGRWISRDPIEENGGLNLFTYVANNPISKTDPSGLKTLPPGPTVCPRIDPDFCDPKKGECFCWRYCASRPYKVNLSECFKRCMEDYKSWSTYMENHGFTPNAKDFNLSDWNHKTDFGQNQNPEPMVVP